VTIPKGQIDRDLPAKLLLEAEGILAWVVAGATSWHLSGLQKPAEVEAAKDRWHSEADQLGRFISECCIAGETLRVPASALYSEYQRWAEACGERAMTGTAFGSRMPNRGYKKRAVKQGTMYFGIGLRASDRGGGGKNAQI